MAGGKVANKEVEQEVPPHAAGREVLSYVERLEKEADADFAAAHGAEETPEEITAREEEEAKAAEDEEKKAEKVVDKEDKGLAGKETVPADDGDLTKGLNTENAVKRISAAQNKMHDSNSRAKTAEEQTSKLQEENASLLKKLEAKSTAPTEAGAEKPDEVKKAVAPAEDELQKSLDELALEYPEIAKPMLKMMARQEVENKKLSEQVATLQENEVTRVKDAKTEKTNTHITAISDVHPDYAEISEDPLLDEWVNGLPEMEKAGAQAIRAGGSTKAVIEFLTRFKQANGYELPAASKEDTPKKPGNSKLDKAKKAGNPSFNKAKDVNFKEGQAPFSRREIDAMSMAEYAKNEPAIDEAMSNGFPPQ
jgi:hypothetical protein